MPKLTSVRRSCERFASEAVSIAAQRRFGLTVEREEARLATKIETLIKGLLKRRVKALEVREAELTRKEKALANKKKDNEDNKAAACSRQRTNTALRAKNDQLEKTNKELRRTIKQLEQELAAECAPKLSVIPKHDAIRP